MSETQVETPAAAAPIPPPAPAAAPIPLTAAPAAVEAAPEVPRTKRKYTKRAVKDAAPKKAKTMKTKAAKKVKAPKAEKKAKRVAGTKAQGQVTKATMRFVKAQAKEKDVTVGALVGIAVERYAKSLGFDPEA